MEVASVPSLDFEKICRICMKDGIMMSIFKVNISKKIMALASVQVWQNDGLPAQICNKCSARLHISFQFKKQCEKSDAKLRQVLLSKQSAKQQEQQNITQEQSQQVEHNNKPVPVDISHQIVQAVQQNSCVYIDCNPILENVSQGQHNFMPAPQVQTPQVTAVEYQQPNQLQLGYNIQGLSQIQVYNGTYIPVNQVQQSSSMPNQEVTQMQILDTIVQHEQPEQQQAPTNEISALNKKNVLKNEKKDNEKTETNYQCPTCNKIFGSTAKLSRHLKTHATDLPYKCKVCTKAFSHSGNFKIHMRMHNDERPFKCVVCGKGCRQAQDLEKHMRVHTGEKPHKCHICPRAFSTSSNLIAHIRIHTGEKPYVCCVCQKGFCQSNELTKHMRTHTGEKSHVCDICHKGFNGSSTLIVHRRSHTGERPYICLTCGKGFAQSSCLAVHVKRHNIEHQCDVCGERFSKQSDFTKHQKTHSGEDG